MKIRTKERREEGSPIPSCTVWTSNLYKKKSIFHGYTKYLKPIILVASQYFEFSSWYTGVNIVTHKAFCVCTIQQHCFVRLFKKQPKKKKKILVLTEVFSVQRADNRLWTLYALTENVNVHLIYDYDWSVNPADKWE